MLKQAQYKMIAGRSVNEILERFNNKIKDPRRAKNGKNVAKIIKDFLKINCSINQAANKLNLLQLLPLVFFCLIQDLQLNYRTYHH